MENIKTRDIEIDNTVYIVAGKRESLYGWFGPGAIFTADKIRALEWAYELKKLIEVNSNVLFDFKDFSHNNGYLLVYSNGDMQNILPKNRSGI